MIIEARHREHQRARNRALGVLTGILIALSVFSLLWYIFVPRADSVYGETNLRETATYHAPIERIQEAAQEAGFQSMSSESSSSDDKGDAQQGDV